MKIMENNNVLKLIAILIAIVLWLYVGTQEDPFIQRTYEVPLTVENLPVDKDATLSQETVRVRVVGRQARLNAIDADDFQAVVDLDEAEEGDRSARVEVALPTEVYFARVEPDHVDVRIGKRAGATHQVEVVTSGELPDGITIDDLSVSPQTVFVTGNPAALDRVAQVGVALDLSTVLDDSESEVAVSFYDSDGERIEGMDLEALPDTVTLTVEVTAEEVEKTVPVQANLVGQLPAGVAIESVSVSPETVTISGSPQELAEISVVQTEAIDLSTLSQSTSRTVALMGEAASGTSVTVTLTVTNESDGQSQHYMKIIPLSVSGQAAGSVSLDTQMVEIYYHMSPGYADAGDSLSAWVELWEWPQAATTVAVQTNSVEGLIIDSISPSSVTVYPLTTE